MQSLPSPTHLSLTPTPSSVDAYVIQARGKVELRSTPCDRYGVPPSRMRFMRPARPTFVSREDLEKPITDLEINTIQLSRRRIAGFAYEVAYWHESWMDDWAIEELLRFEGREDEIRRDKFYGEYFSTEDQPSRAHESDKIDAAVLATLGYQRSLSSGVPGEVHRRVVARGDDDSRQPQPDIFVVEPVRSRNAIGVSREDDI